MGYMRRHAIIVTAFNEKDIERARAEALRIFGQERPVPAYVPRGLKWKPELEIGMVSTVVQGVANGELSFFVGPDGSKEGWAHSDEGDSRRAEFVAWLRRPNSMCYWVELFYGDDGGDAAILNRSGDGRE